MKTIEEKIIYWKNLGKNLKGFEAEKYGFFWLCIGTCTLILNLKTYHAIAEIIGTKFMTFCRFKNFLFQHYFSIIC